MGNISRLIGTMLLFSHVSLAQNPADVSFAISIKNGQTAFRMGEAIPIELRFQTTNPGRYQVITDPSQRIHLNGNRVYERFTGEPAAEAIDPLREQTRMFEILTGPQPKLEQLKVAPIAIEQVVNDWISFRKPGRYRITAQTQRLSLVDSSKDPAQVFLPQPLPMQSNTVEIKIIPAEDNWSNNQLQKAVASLSQSVNPSAIGQTVNLQRQEGLIAAARVLRFLNTRDAALAMVRFFDHGLNDTQGDLMAGLYGSPYRNEIIAALEEGLASPEVPVTPNWINMLAELATARDFGPAPLDNKDSSNFEAWNKHFMVYRERCMQILSNAVEKNRDKLVP